MEGRSCPARGYTASPVCGDCIQAGCVGGARSHLNDQGPSQDASACTSFVRYRKTEDVHNESGK